MWIFFSLQHMPASFSSGNHGRRRNIGPLCSFCVISLPAVRNHDIYLCWLSAVIRNSIVATKLRVGIYLGRYGQLFDWGLDHPTASILQMSQHTSHFLQFTWPFMRWARCIRVCDNAACTVFAPVPAWQCTMMYYYTRFKQSSVTLNIMYICTQSMLIHSWCWRLVTSHIAASNG